MVRKDARIYAVCHQSALCLLPTGLHIHLPTFRHCRLWGAGVSLAHIGGTRLFYDLRRVRGWHRACNSVGVREEPC